MISVIIPTYNRGRCISRAMDSVLQQTYSDIELIIVDDGSDDETEQVVGQYTDPRVRYIKQEHSGACVARNRGIAESQGQWIAFQDSDDWWFENKLEKQMEALEKNGADIVFCAFDRGPEEALERDRVPSYASRPSGFIRVGDLLPGNICSTQTLLFSRKCFEQDRFNEALPRLQDWELMLRMTKKWRVYFLDEVLVSQYLQNDSISAKSEAYFDALGQIFNLLSEMYKEQECRYGEMQSALDTVLNSRSWKVTKPLRSLLGYMKGLKGSK